MYKFTTIDTPRLILRLLEPDAHDYIFAQPDDQIMRLLGFAQPEQLAAEKEKYRKGYRNFKTDYRNFQIIHKDSQTIIGHCGFHTWYPEHRRAEIGYALDAEISKNQGFMRELFPYVLDFGFNQMQLHRVEAFVGPNNEPSLRLVRRFGFAQEGHLKEHYFKNGYLDDSVVFALFARDWQGL